MPKVVRGAVGWHPAPFLWPPAMANAAGRAMFPDDTVIAGWADFAAVAAWAGVPEPILRAYLAALGGRYLPGTLVLAAAPPRIHERPIAEFDPAARVDQVRVCVLVDAVRLKVDMQLAELMPPPAPPDRRCPGQGRGFQRRSSRWSCSRGCASLVPD